MHTPNSKCPKCEKVYYRYNSSGHDYCPYCRDHIDRLGIDDDFVYICECYHDSATEQQVIAQLSAWDTEDIMECPICFNEFIPTVKTQIYCSRECYEESNRKGARRRHRENHPNWQFKCLKCGKPTRNQWTHCPQCKDQFKRYGVYDLVGEEIYIDL